jgi:hypothetical protein
MSNWEVVFQRINQFIQQNQYRNAIYFCQQIELEVIYYSIYT